MRAIVLRVVSYENAVVDDAFDEAAQHSDVESEAADFELLQPMVSLALPAPELASRQ